MFKKMMGSLLTGMMRRQMDTFVTRLQGMDGDEIGGVVLMALDISSELKSTTGVDLFEPAICVKNNSALILQLSTRAQNMEREGQPMLAVGLTVWVHTLRAMTEGDIRGLGRQMWGNLSVGFPMSIRLRMICEKQLAWILMCLTLGDFRQASRPNR